MLIRSICDVIYEVRITYNDVIYRFNGLKYLVKFFTAPANLFHFASTFLLLFSSRLAPLACFICETTALN